MAGMLPTAEAVSGESIGASKQAEAVQLPLGLLELSKHAEAVQLKLTSLATVTMYQSQRSEAVHCGYAVYSAHSKQYRATKH